MAVKTQLEPPEGGWGILICVGMALPFISCLSSIPAFGLVFGDFFKSIGAETSAIAFITSFYFCALSFAGLLSGALYKRFSLRTVGLWGGILYFAGSVAQIFATSIWHLAIAFSILQGAGFGLIIPTSYTTFNNYFVKKRIVWMSFAQSLIGLGGMLYPLLMQKLLDLYGFRGCLIVLAAINAHAIFGMLLMQPVEWHMRRVEVEEPEELKVITTLDEKSQLTIVPEIVAPEEGETNNIHEALKNVESEHEKVHHLAPLMHNSQNHSKYSRESLRRLSRRSSSILSLGNWSGPIVVSDASPEMKMHSRAHSTRASLHEGANSIDKIGKRTLTVWDKIVDFLDLTLMKESIYVNIALGMSFALYSDVAFFTLQPLYLFELGFSKQDTATIIATGAAADLGSRIFLAISAIFVQMPSRYIFLAGCFFTIIGRFAFLNVFDFMGMACITAILGFLRTWIHVPLPLVFAEYLPKERFGTGYGLFMFLQGNILFLVGPIVGWLRDTTQNYPLTFHVATLFMALCALPWILEIVCVKFRRKQKLGSSY